MQRYRKQKTFNKHTMNIEQKLQELEERIAITPAGVNLFAV